MRIKTGLLLLMIFGLTSCLKPKTEGVEVLNADQFEQKLQMEDVQLVDVRTADEFAEGHLPNAINIDINGDEFELQTAKLDKEKPVMVYCKMGGRSAKAASKLKEQGFKNITDLDGGITSWKEAEKNIEN